MRVACFFPFKIQGSSQKQKTWGAVPSVNLRNSHVKDRPYTQLAHTSFCSLFEQLVTSISHRTLPFQMKGTKSNHQLCNCLNCGYLQATKVTQHHLHGYGRPNFWLPCELQPLVCKLYLRPMLLGESTSMQLADCQASFTPLCEEL